MRRLNCALLSLGVLLSPVAVRAQAVKRTESSVEKYRIDSQFGPEESVMGLIYPHDSKFEVSLGGSLSNLSALYKYSAATGSAVVHINRRHAIEPIFYSRHFTNLSNFVKTQVRDKVGSGTQDSVEVAVPKQVIAASYFFTPYYSKLHLSSQSVAHFDVYLGAGVGGIQNIPTSLSGNEGTPLWAPTGVATAGVRFLFRPRFALRAEVRDYVYSSTNFGKKSLSNGFEVAASLSIFFGSFN